MKKQPTKLPDKPSALIRLALRDLEKCERSKLYKIDMSTWFEPNGKCRVCLAGAVMAQTLECPIEHELVPCMLDDANDAKKLDALDSFRCGDAPYALHVMGIAAPTAPIMDICPYKTNTSRFKRDMRKMATLLAKAGL